MSSGVAVPAFAGELCPRGLAPFVDHGLNRVPPRRGFACGTFEEFLKQDQEFSHHLTRIRSRLRLAGKLLGDCEHDCLLCDEWVVSIGFMCINGFVNHIPVHRLGDKEDAERVGLMKVIGPNTFVVEERLKIQEAGRKRTRLVGSGRWQKGLSIGEIVVGTVTERRGREQLFLGSVGDQCDQRRCSRGSFQADDSASSFEGLVRCFRPLAV